MSSSLRRLEQHKADNGLSALYVEFPRLPKTLLTNFGR